MAMKLSRQKNHKNVFTRVLEDADSSEPGDAQTVEDASDPIAAKTVKDTAGDENDLTAGTPADHDAPETDDAEEINDPEETDDGDETHTTVSAPRRRWLRYSLTGAAILISIAALSAAGFFGWQYKQHQDVERAGRAALQSAEHFAVILTSIDTGSAGSVDQNFDQVVDGSTGEFKSMYSQSASQLRQVLIDNKAMSKGTVIDSAVKSASKTKVDVLLFVDQWINNSASPQPRMDRSRVTMTMEFVDGRWLASNVELK